MDWLSCFPMEWLSEVLLLKGVNGELVSAFVYSERGIVEKFWGEKKKRPFPKAPLISISQHGHFRGEKQRNSNNL